MSMRSFESLVLRAARTALNNKKLRLKDILQWNTGDIEAREGEIVVNVPDPGVFVCVAIEHDKRVQP